MILCRHCAKGLWDDIHDQESSDYHMYDADPEAAKAAHKRIWGVAK